MALLVLLAWQYVGWVRATASSVEITCPDEADVNEVISVNEVPDPLVIEFRDGNHPLLLRTLDARQQILATTHDGRDVTRDVRWKSVPEGIIEVDSSGRIQPLADGTATLQATLPDGTTASRLVEVVDTGVSLPVHFANRIVPVFTKLGCNGGGCHGKADGQNGFRLSLLGFEPTEDYEHLVREARGRRVFPGAPERSLLLTKAIAEVPHGGGKRLESGSDDHELLVRWIRQGMPQGAADAATVSHLEVFPKHRSLALNGSQQLVVTAIFTDGTTEDVTRGALYEPNEPDLARCDENGLVTAANQPGEVAVMVRYQGRVGTFRATLPLGAPVETLPVARNFIDEHIFRQLRLVGMPPSEIADDATFLRRVTLDIVGRLPTLEEVIAVQNEAPEFRRETIVDRLLASPDYAGFFANKWAALLRNKRTDPRHARGAIAFHGAIRDHLDANVPYDRFVRELLTASGDIADNPFVTWYRQVRSMQGQLEDVSQLFLGQRLQCAQCHHHPYERWSQADYWSFGAAFSQVSFKPGSQPTEDILMPSRGEARTTNRKNGQQVKSAGLAASPFELSVDDDPREALADWMTSPENPWFAKSLVNRYWKHFFGRGLVDPEDDMRETNPPTHPELLDALAEHFVSSGFDLKELVRTIALSSTYQLSAEPNEHNARDRHHFSRFQPRRLPAEVLFDSIHAVAGSEVRFDGLPTGTRAVDLPDNSFNASSYFLTVFGRPEGSSACECERTQEASLSQSLHLINSKEIHQKIAADTARAARLAADPRDVTSKLVDLYRITSARDPSEAEIQAAQKHLAQIANRAGSEVKDAASDEEVGKALREGWEDIVWALINTKEFIFNH